MSVFCGSLCNKMTAGPPNLSVASVDNALQNREKFVKIDDSYGLVEWNVHTVCEQLGVWRRVRHHEYVTDFAEGVRRGHIIATGDGKYRLADWSSEVEDSLLRATIFRKTGDNEYEHDEDGGLGSVVWRIGALM